MTDPVCIHCGKPHPPIKGCGWRDPEKTITIAAEDGKEGVECPVCGRDFDNHWNTVSVAGDAWGGTAREECPTDGCRGLVKVLY